MSIADANKVAGDRILGALPFLERVRPALDVLPGMKRNKILHAGPPALWGALPDPVRGGIVATARFEGLAADEDEAMALIRRGQIEIGACHEHGAVGPATGIISASTPLLVVKNQTAGNVAGSYVRQGFGRTLTFGAYDTDGGGARALALGGDGARPRPRAPGRRPHRLAQLDRGGSPSRRRATQPQQGRHLHARRGDGDQDAQGRRRPLHGA